MPLTFAMLAAPSGALWAAIRVTLALAGALAFSIQMAVPDALV